jgi:hypothetical protein
MVKHEVALQPPELSEEEAIKLVISKSKLDEISNWQGLAI